MTTKPSLHLSRPAEPQPQPKALTVNLRTVEHYRLKMDMEGDIDPDLG
jgi:hypothetical protein